MQINQLTLPKVLPPVPERQKRQTPPQKPLENRELHTKVECNTSPLSLKVWKYIAGSWWSSFDPCGDVNLAIARICTICSLWIISSRKNEIQKTFKLVLVTIKNHDVISLERILNNYSAEVRSQLFRHKDDKGFTLLHHACLTNQKILLTRLLIYLPESEIELIFQPKEYVEGKKEPLSMTLFAHASECNAAIYVFIECAYAASQLTNLLQQVDNQGHTLLHHVCFEGNAALLKFILDKLKPSEFSKVLLIKTGKLGPPVFYALQKSETEIISILANYSLENFLSARSNSGCTILHALIAFGNKALFNLFDEIFQKTSQGAAFQWKHFLQTYNDFKCFPLAYGPIREDDQSLQNEKIFIKMLIKISAYYERTEFIAALSAISGSNQGLLFHACVRERFLLAEYLMGEYPELLNDLGFKNYNLLHALAHVESGVPQEDKRITFFNKLPKVICSRSFNEFDKNGYLPIYLARSYSLHQLAECYLRGGTDQALADKAHIAKYVAHSWSVEYRHSQNHSKEHLHLKKLHGWTTQLCYEELTSSLTQFCQNFPNQLDQVTLNFYQNCAAMFKVACQPMLVDGVLQIIQDDKPWILPISLNKHSFCLVGFKNQLIIVDRSPFSVTLSNTGERVVFDPGFKCFRLSSDITRSNLQDLLQIKGHHWNVYSHLFNLQKVTTAGFIPSKPQRARNCTLTNGKGAILAALYLQHLAASSIEKDHLFQKVDMEAFKTAKQLCQPFVVFQRFQALKSYRSLVDRYDPLLIGIEAKACLKFAFHRLSAEAQPSNVESLPPNIKAIIDERAVSQSYRTSECYNKIVRWLEYTPHWQELLDEIATTSIKSALATFVLINSLSTVNQGSIR